MKSLLELKNAASVYKVKAFGYETSEAPEDSIVIKWDVAGARGGNCWGGKARDIRPEEEPIDEFERKVIEVYEFVIGLNFVDEEERNRFVSEAYYATTEKENEEHEYYGNWIRYNYRYIGIEEVYRLIYEFSRVGRIDDILEDLENNGL